LLNFTITDDIGQSFFGSAPQQRYPNKSKKFFFTAMMATPIKKPETGKNINRIFLLVFRKEKEAVPFGTASL